MLVQAEERTIIPIDAEGEAASAAIPEKAGGDDRSWRWCGAEDVRRLVTHSLKACMGRWWSWTIETPAAVHSTLTPGTRRSRGG